MRNNSSPFIIGLIVLIWYILPHCSSSYSLIQLGSSEWFTNPPKGVLIISSSTTTWLIPRYTSFGISHVVVDEEIMRTPLGGFVNHSEDPNCIKVFEEEEWGKIYHMRTIKDIKEGEELFLKYTFYNV